MNKLFVFFSTFICWSCYANEPIIFHPFDVISPNVPLEDLCITKIELIETAKPWNLFTKSQVISDRSEIKDLIEAFRSINIKSDDIRKQNMPLRGSFSKKAVVYFFSNDFMRHLEVEHSVESRWWQFRYSQDGGLFNSSINYGIDDSGKFVEELFRIRGPVQTHFRFSFAILILFFVILTAVPIFLFIRKAKAVPVLANI